MKDQARIVVVGGGIIGCAVAFHLGRAGFDNVCVVDKGELAAGTTSQGAGLIGQFRTSAVKCRLFRQTIDDFRVLSGELGEETGFRQCGSLRVALTAQREAGLRAQVEFARSQGVEVELIDARTAEQLACGLDLRRARVAAWVPSDGYVDPYTLAMAYARSARKLGVEFRAGARVNGIGVDRGRVSRVITDQGEIKTEWVVDAAGAWSELIGAMVGVEVPLFPVRHQSWITAPLDWLSPSYPVVRIPDLWTYLRLEVGGLLIGFFESTPAGMDIRELPAGFEMSQLPRNWEVLATYVEPLFEVMPALREAPIINAAAGLPTFTPDGHLAVGPVSGVGGFVVASGCCAQGIVGSGGIGRLVADLISGETPTVDSSVMAVERFEGAFRERGRLRTACERVYGTYYGLAAAGPSMGVCRAC